MTFAEQIKTLTPAQLDKLEAMLIHLNAAKPNLEELVARLRSPVNAVLSNEAEARIGARTYELSLENMSTEYAALRRQAEEDYAAGKLKPKIKRYRAKPKPRGRAGSAKLAGHADGSAAITPLAPASNAPTEPAAGPVPSPAPTKPLPDNVVELRPLAFSKAFGVGAQPYWTE